MDRGACPVTKQRSITVATWTAHPARHALGLGHEVQIRVTAGQRRAASSRGGSQCAGGPRGIGEDVETRQRAALPAARRLKQARSSIVGTSPLRFGPRMPTICPFSTLNDTS